MKRRILSLVVILSLVFTLSMVFTVVPVAANEEIWLGDGEWCEYQGDGLWFCFENGPTIHDWINSYSTTA